MAAAKPDVVITFVVLEIEMRFKMLIPCFQEAPTQWHIDRQLVPTASIFAELNMAVAKPEVAITFRVL